MANKRNLKKYIKYTCGDIAGECIFAKIYFAGVDDNKMDEIIVKAAGLQTTTIDKVSVSFDKTPKTFGGNLADYRKAKKQYFKECYKALKQEFVKDIENIVCEMNAALSQEQKEANKAALSNN